MDALLAHGSVWLLSACLALLASGLLAGVLAGLIGVLIGALTSRYLAGGWLTGIFATMAMLIAIKMSFDFKAANLGATLPSRFVTGFFGCFIGGVSILIGVGGGALSVPILSSFNIPMRIAVGTSALVGGHQHPWHAGIHAQWLGC